MRRKLLAILLAALMVTQAAAPAVFAGQTGDGSAGFNTDEQSGMSQDDVSDEAEPSDKLPDDESDGEKESDKPQDGESDAEDNTSAEGNGTTGEAAVFNFSAAKYVVSEADDSYEITVERQGAADMPSDVVFKAVDVFAVYGEDYAIVDENGTVLEKTKGTVISPEELTRLASAAAEETGGETAEASREDTEASREDADASRPKNDIFEARNVLMGIDSEAQDQQELVKDEITTAVETVNSDLFDAEGVSGVLHFAGGETKKNITVVPVNNDRGEADKTVLMALLGASEGGIAPNATATLTIMDDEEYIPPVFEMAQGDITLDSQNPTAELTVRRVSGENYYSTVFVSTYSMTAKSGDDFTAVEKQQVVFAPGETEKTIGVEALSFSKSGDFGVRIKSDGSCEIGESDRTIVHIRGERSASESSAEQTDRTNSMSLQAASANASSVMAVSGDGVVGQPYYLIPEKTKLGLETTIGVLYGSYGSRPKSISLGSSTYVQSALGKTYLQLDLGHSYPVVSSTSVTVKFTVSSSYVSSSYDHNFIIYPGQFDAAKTSGYNSGNEVQKIEARNGSFEVQVSKKATEQYLTIVFPYRTFMNFGVEEVRLDYDEPAKTSVQDIRPIQTQPVIDLDNDVKADQIVNYTPPKPSFRTDDDLEVRAVYPADGVVRVITDEEDLMKNGVILYATYVEEDVYRRTLYPENRIDVCDLFRRGGSLSVFTELREVNVHLQSADNGDTYIHTKNNSYKKPFKATTGTMLRGSGYAAAGKAITGYDIYAAKLNGEGEIGETKFLYTYQNPKNSSLLGGVSPEEWFHVPAVQEDGWTEVLVQPRTEIQNLVVKPHPSTKDETVYEDIYDDEGNVIGQREVTYEGRAYLNRTFDDSAGGDDTYVADENGQICFEKINSGSVFTLRSVSPLGYLTEWINGTMDKDGDGVIDNAQAGDMSQGTADDLYVPVYGNQFVYQANQSSPQYYYRFTKFDPSRLLNGKTRVGYVKKDKRTILEYNGKEAQYKDYVPCAGATVKIGENESVTDSAGRFEIKMDGVPDAVRVSAAVTTDSGNFITHVQSNVENNIFIPFYDTFEPQKVTAAYKDQAAVSAPGIAIADKELKVTVKVKHSANSMYIKSAGFYITDSSGKKVVDCNTRAESENSNYKVEYTNDGTFGYAELRMNPGEDMLSGYKIYVYFTDQNGTEHRAMDTGHRFMETLNLGTFILGAIGSSFVTDATTEVVDLLGAPLFDFNMGQIDGFTSTSGVIEPDVQMLDESGNKMYEYDATLYSYRYEADGLGNWSGGSGGDKENPEGGDSGSGSGGESGGSGSGSSGEGGGDSGGGESGDADAGDYQAQHGEILNKMKEVSSFDPDEVESESAPKAASMDNGEKSVTKNSEYNFELTPSVRFDLITTARPAGKDENGNDIYKHYFEEMSLGVGLGLDVNSRTEISFPIGISVMIKPSLTGSVEAVYYMKTDYSDDKYWQRPIEYSPESFGIFDNYGGRMYRAGYISLNPKITIDVGVKVAIVEVDVGASFDFDMDFKFDSSGETKTYGNMKYDIHINLIILKLSVYSKKMVDGELHLFGEDEPLGSGGVSLMSSRMNSVLAEAVEDGDTTVRPVDRSYLDDRSQWKGEGAEAQSFFARLFRADGPMDEDHPADALLQTGVMTGDKMDSAMLDTDTMFAVYVDDDPDRGANDRSCVYYTYTNDDGSWTSPAAIEDDGTLDKDPVVYDMGDKLFVAWLTAEDTFDGKEDSLETIRQQLNSLNIHAAFFDKKTKKFGKVFKVTENTEDDRAAEGDIAVTRIGEDGIRVYYTKTEYLENPENVNALIAASSVIAYRDYRNGAWDAEYTEEEKQKIEAGGMDAGEYTDQWYGQRFEDTRLNGRWPLVTDLEADIAPGGEWEYFAFIADGDGSYETSSDRKIYFNFGTYDAPVCITPEPGAYDDLQFVYSGEELIMTFKSTAEIEGQDGERRNVGGISYINLSEVFEKADYRAVKQPDGTYQMALEGTTGGGEPVYYTPEPAVTMDGVVQKYEAFSSRGGRIYLMWTDNTLNDDGTSSIQVYASVYNGKAEWVQDIDRESGYYGARWSHPVMLTSPTYGSYDTFTAQSITGDGIAFVARRTNLSDQTEMVFHLREPYAVFTFNEDLLSTRYAYIGVPVTIRAEITNAGLKAQKTETETENDQNTWVALPGVYQIRIERLVDGDPVETLSESEVDTIWNVGDTIYAQYEWTPQELPDNMDLRVSVRDKATGEEICSELVPVVKAAEVELGQVDAVSEIKNGATVSFDILNRGNIPAELTAVVSILTGEDKKIEAARAEIGEVAAAESKSQEIYVPIDEKYQTIDAAGGNGAFRLQIDILSGDETVYSTTASGAVLYSPEAIADVEEIESLSVEQTSVSLKSGETAEINAALEPASAAERNKVIYVSSDAGVAAVDQNGKITAVGKGSATITAYAVSGMEFSAVQPDGSTRLLDVKDFIPDSMIKSQEIKVSVSGGSAGGTGGGTSSCTVTFNSMGGSRIDSVSVDRNGTLKEPKEPARDGFIFGGWFTDRECTQEYDFSTKVTKSFTLYAKWAEAGGEPSGWKNPFTDVKSTDWFYDYVRYAYENGLFTGISGTEFDPNGGITRAMIVTVLYRAEGEPDIGNEGRSDSFDDVALQSWYGPAVYWAQMNGIVKGYSDEVFAPDKLITREEMAAIMYRYAGYKGVDTSAAGDLSQFSDQSQIANWARGNVEWTVGYGLISGRSDGTLDPKGNITRAETAAILQRFLEK